MSLDSARIRGEDQDVEDDEAASNYASVSKIKLNKVEIDEASMMSSQKMTRSQKSVTIKMSKIEVSDVTLSSSDSDTISKTLFELTGIIDCQIETKSEPNLVKVSYRSNGTALRDIIKTV